jgi:ornithine carbamoyltransferase
MSDFTFGSLQRKDLTTVADLSASDIATIFRTAAELKRNRRQHDAVLKGRKLAMIFEKDSLRTRFTFDVGMQDLGGHAVFMDHRDARIGARESIKDIARNLERWVDAIVARTYKHRVITELAEHCSIPVINGLTDYLHPCQALSDFFTLHEKWDGRIAGKRITYVGDGNNTCHSLIHTAAKLGAHIAVCTPEGYEPNAKVIHEAMRNASETGAEITVLDDPHAAVDGADAVYTDVWASMGQEDEVEERNAVFLAYQVDEELMARANRDAVFMHCLPAHRGAEVTAEVVDGPQSVVYDIAENRLHVQKAILVLLLNGR